MIGATREEMVWYWSWLTLTRIFEEGALLMSELISVEQHISIYRRARSKTFAGCGHREPAIGAGDGLKRHLADRKQHPGALISFEQDDFGNADARGNLALKRQGHRLLPRQPPGQPIQHRQCKRPPRP